VEAENVRVYWVSYAL